MIKVASTQLYIGNLFTAVYSLQPALGINKVNANQVSFEMYPNPASQLLNIDFTEAGTANMHIFNSLGQDVYSEVIDRKSVFVNTSEFTKGLYFMKIEQNGLVSTRKLIIQ